MTTYAGLQGDAFTLNGADLLLPRVAEVHNVLAQTLTPASARPKIDVQYLGEGLPNVPDRFEWVLQYDLADDQGTTIATLERLRTKGGVHLFADWVKRFYTWTVRSGQKFLYLPRQDAFSLAYSGHTAAAWKAIVRLNGTPLTLTYQSTVASGDSVPSGQVYISNATTVHADSGLTAAPFKVGTALTAGDEVEVEYYALFRVGVVDVPTVPFEMVEREDKAVYLAEVA